MQVLASEFVNPKACYQPYTLSAICGISSRFTGDTSSSMTCVKDDATSTRSSFEVTARRVRSSVIAADCAATRVDARPITRETDRSLTGRVEQASLAVTTAQLTARQPRLTVAAVSETYWSPGETSVTLKGTQAGVGLAVAAAHQL